jgi:predicted SAM-dependent methyltransferase
MSPGELLRLNFACGGSRWPGFVNTDVAGDVERVDLGEFPYPYPDESASIIMISHGLFHTVGGAPVVADRGRVFREFRRILAPGGWLRIDDNPLRCYDDGDLIDPGEVAEEMTRGYPDELRVSRDTVKGELGAAGFTVYEVVGDTTLVTADPATTAALIGNRMGHVSFTLEARR